MAPLEASTQAGSLADGQTLCAEVAFFNHTLHAGGEFFIVGFDEGTRIPEVEASCTEGTGRHTEAAADAAVEIHHDDAVVVLKGRLGGAGPHARWIFAVIAQQQKRPVLHLFIEESYWFYR
jgi:hypothetical protein